MLGSPLKAATSARYALLLTAQTGLMDERTDRSFISDGQRIFLASIIVRDEDNVTNLISFCLIDEIVPTLALPRACMMFLKCLQCANIVDSLLASIFQKRATSMMLFLTSPSGDVRRRMVRTCFACGGCKVCAALAPVQPVVWRDQKAYTTMSKVSDAIRPPFIDDFTFLLNFSLSFDRSAAASGQLESNLL